ncbi:binding [Zea mays]|uniref:Binding n=1 Tax=Zea mays TaxID=4577 RepID=A0A1D6MSJ0_MAIZE|nr:binding [Zea mays]
MILNDFFPKIVDIFRMCEDLENIDDLHMIFKLVKGIILLNSPSIFDKIFSDEFILDIIGALEYDPEVPRVQNHRAFLKDHVVFKEAIRIENVSVVSKIHQTYRIGYLKDVILPRILDDATLASLNTMIHSNNASVISLLKDDTLFIRRLFARMRSSDISMESKRELVLFLHEFCTLSKSLPLVQQLRLFRTDILILFLNQDPNLLRSYIVQQEGNSLLGLLLKGRLYNENLYSTGVEFGLLLLDLMALMVSSARSCAAVPLVKGMVTDFSEEMHCQFLEILRILMDSFTTSGAHRDVVIEIFYERHLDYLVDVIASSCPPRSLSRSSSNSVHVGGNAEGHCIKPEILLNVCELLCFCVVHHPYRIKCNFLMNNAIEKILTLTQRREKFLVVAAVRFMRTIISRNDDHLIRHVVKFNLLKPIIDVFVDNGERYNMLHSGVLELLEYIRKENIKTLIIYAIESFWDELAIFEHFGSIQAFKLKYQQNLSFCLPYALFSEMASLLFLPFFDKYLESAEPRLNASVPDMRKKAEQRGLEKEEEDYFNEDSDEEDSGSGRRAKHAQNQNNKPKSKVPNGSEADDTDGASRPKSAGLVDYDDDDDEDFNPPPKEPSRPAEDDVPLNISPLKRKPVNAVDGKHSDGEGRRRQKIETRISCAKIAAVTSTAIKHTDLQNKYASHLLTSATPSTEANGIFSEHGTNYEEQQHPMENTETSRQTGGDCIKDVGSMSPEKAVNTTNTSDSEPYSVYLRELQWYPTAPEQVYPRLEKCENITQVNMVTPSAKKNHVFNQCQFNRIKKNHVFNQCQFNRIICSAVCFIRAHCTTNLRRLLEYQASTGSKEWRKLLRLDSNELDQYVQGRSGGVLEGVADDGSFLSVRPNRGYI